MTAQNKKGRGKNSDKLIGEVVQIDLVMLEWFYQKIPFNDLVKYFNVCEGTLTRVVKHYGFKSDKELISKRRSDKTSQRTDWKTGKDSENFKDRVGERFITREGYETEIIDYISSDECIIQFTNDSSFTHKSSYYTVSRGGISYPYHKTVHEVGYLGIGKHSIFKDRDMNKKYECWQGMISRCYSETLHSRQPRYVNCTVDESWHNYQEFGDWFDENYKPYMQKWQLDKDILFKGNKIYSPETCCFVPKDINLLFTKNEARRGEFPLGVFQDNGRYRAVVVKYGISKYYGSHNTPEEAFKAYKTAKEDHIKYVADKWRDLIDLRVYNAMYNYQVNIND